MYYNSHFSDVILLKTKLKSCSLSCVFQSEHAVRAGLYSR